MAPQPSNAKNRLEQLETQVGNTEIIVKKLQKDWDDFKVEWAANKIQQLQIHTALCGSAEFQQTGLVRGLAKLKSRVFRIETFGIILLAILTAGAVSTNGTVGVLQNVLKAILVK